MLCEVAATFAQLLVRGGNRVGAILYDDDVQGPSRPGRAAIRCWCWSASCCARSSGRRGDRPRPLLDLAARTRPPPVAGRRRCPTSSASRTGNARCSGSPSATRSSPSAWSIRREFELPDAGLLVVQDAETGEQLLVDSSDPELRRRLLAAAEAQEGPSARPSTRAGVDLHTMSTEEDLRRRLRPHGRSPAAGDADDVPLAGDARWR